MLAAFGLDLGQERVYRSLLRSGPVTPAQLAADTGEPGAREALAALADRGLVARTGGTPERWTAVPPDLALRPLLVRQQETLELARLTVANLVTEYAQYQQDAGRRSAADLVELVSGAEAIRHRFEQVELGARGQVSAFVTPPDIAITGPENEAEERAVRRGIRFRVLFDRAGLELPGMLAEIDRALPTGVEVRVAAELPTKLVIADRELALVGARLDAEEPHAFLVRPSGLLDALAALFEVLWEQSRCYDRVTEVAVAAGLSEVDSRVLELLLAGLTDDAVAKQLGLSTRTVQRHVQRLMRLAMVQTRTQLGWHAAVHGWC